MVDLSVVVVSYNTRLLLKACLESVWRAIACSAAERTGSSLPAQSTAQPMAIEVIVVDNGSADGSADMVRTHFPVVRLIDGENVGFASGSNKGIAIAGGRYVLLLNPDTEVVADALVALVRFMDAHPQAGAAGGHLLNPDGSFQQSAFRFPTRLMSLFDFYHINHRVLNSRLNGRYPLSRYGASFQIDHPLGACLLIRREALEQVGPLDEAFFMYCEEMDWCMRIKRAAWEIWYVAEARVIHHGAQSTSQFRYRMYVELFRSRARFFAKYHSRAYCWSNHQIVRLGLGREMLQAWRARRSGRIDQQEYAERLAAYSEVWGL